VEKFSTSTEWSPSMSVVEQNFVPLVAYSAMIWVTAIDGSCIKFGAATMSSLVMPFVSVSYT